MVDGNNPVPESEGGSCTSALARISQSDEVGRAGCREVDGRHNGETSPPDAPPEIQQKGNKNSFLFFVAYISGKSHFSDKKFAYLIK